MIWLSYVYNGLRFDFKSNEIILTDLRHGKEKPKYRITIDFSYDIGIPFKFELIEK